MQHVRADLDKLTSLPMQVSVMQVTVDNLPTRRDVTDAFDRHLKWTLGIVGLMLTAATVIISFFR